LKVIRPPPLFTPTGKFQFSFELDRGSTNTNEQ